MPREAFHRAGVRVTRAQARIFDAVEHAGPDGVDLHEVFGIELSRHQIRAQVWHLNRKLAPVGLRLVDTRPDKRVRTSTLPYRLERIGAQHGPE